MSQQVLERPTTPTAVAAPTKQYPPLTALDRCDARTITLLSGTKTLGHCGAQAFIRVVLPSGLDLIFCGHCLGEQTEGKDTTGTKSATQATRRAKLKATGARFLSDYDKINLKPTDPNSGAF